MRRILGIGDNTVDTYVSSRQQYPGGNTVNVAALARRLGAFSGWLGCVGDDSAGELIQLALRAENVDISRLRVCQGANARAFISHMSGDRHFLGAYPGVRAHYQLTAEDDAYIAKFDLAHTSIYSELDSQLERLQTNTGRLSYDYSNRWDEARLYTTLPHVDMAFLSVPEADDAYCQYLLYRCLQWGASQVVITRGAGGAMGADGSDIYVQPIMSSQVIDTLGAGDGFIAAFMLAALDGANLPQCLVAGADFAARVCEWKGGFGHGVIWNGEGEYWLQQHNLTEKTQ